MSESETPIVRFNQERYYDARHVTQELGKYTVQPIMEGHGMLVEFAAGTRLALLKRDGEMDVYKELVSVRVPRRMARPLGRLVNRV